jgi:hypothetical protein
MPPHVRDVGMLATEEQALHRDHRAVRDAIG